MADPETPSTLPPEAAETPEARLAKLRARQLEAVTEIARAATSSFDLDIVLRKSIDLIRERLGFYHVSVFLIDPHTREAMLRQATAGAGYALIAHEYQLKIGAESLLTSAIHSSQPSLVQDVTAMPGFTPNPLLPETRAECVIPLLTGRTVVGALELKSVAADAFSPEMVALLQGIAALLAVAIQNVRLYESEFSRRLLAETLQEAGHLLSSTLNLDEVLKRLLGQLARAVPYDRAAVLLQSGEMLEVAAVSGFADPESARQMQVPLAPGDIFSHLRAARKPLILTDVTQEAAWPRAIWEAKERFWVGAPLLVHDDVIGLIVAARDRVGAYAQEEAEVIFAFANQAAVAIDNARLYDRVTRFNQELEQRVTERTAELERALYRLEKLDRNKSDFINIVAHELRTPLTVVQGYSSLLKVDPVIQSNTHLSDVIGGMLNGAGRLHEIINRMLEAARVNGQVLDLHPRRVDFNRLLVRVHIEYKPALQERSLTLKLEDLSGLPVLLADEDLLFKVFSNLVSNAIKYTPDGGRITIHGCVRTEGEGQWVDVMVQDTGIGIAPDNYDVIFEPLYQTGPVALHSSGKTKFKGGGTGLGLAIARSIMQAHNGRIWAESKGYDEVTCPGSCFHVLLPVPDATA
jgi:signal transduction histidine kinase